ncbi:MAG TPA: hypothetical protein VHV83_08155 [Armatimonadota bacterium]|nr:hypothetical protein [Armatimonadota bacterium]
MRKNALAGFVEALRTLSDDDRQAIAGGIQRLRQSIHTLTPACKLKRIAS